ncbi:MAG: metallophosphoesterase [archaeon]
MTQFIVNKQIHFLGNTVFLPLQHALVFSDLHLGIETTLRNEGLLIPTFSFKEILQQLKTTLEMVKSHIGTSKKTGELTIVLNGDIKHEFGKISEVEWRDARALITFLQEFGKVIIIAGNHDKQIFPIAKALDVPVEPYVRIDGTFICHGDVIPKPAVLRKAKTIIIGHEHPAVGIRELSRVEKFKCFLVGKWKNKTLIVMPSMQLINEGTDMLKERRLSPFLQGSIENFDVYVVSDKILHFGKIRQLR